MVHIHLQFHFLLLFLFPANTKQTSASATAVTPVPLSHPGELEELQSILHFPEEVALRLTDAEYQLFYQVCVIHIGHRDRYFEEEKKLIDSATIDLICRCLLLITLSM